MNKTYVVAEATASAIPAAKEREFKVRPKVKPTGLPVTLLKVSCGCGAAFRGVPEGEFHAMETGHTLHITGKIESQK